MYVYTQQDCVVEPTTMGVAQVVVAVEVGVLPIEDLIAYMGLGCGF